MKASGDVTRLNIQLGTPLILQLKGIEDRHNSVLLGMEEDKFLLIRKPHPSQLRATLSEGTALIIRFITHGTVWGFEASVLGNVHKPPRLMFITYPDRVEHLSLRKHNRVGCRIPATIFAETGEYKGLITDISTGGSRFKAQLPMGTEAVRMKPNSRVKLSLPFLGMDGMQTFEGIIRNLSQDGEGFSVGIQFQNVRTEVALKIEKYILQIEEYDK